MSVLDHLAQAAAVILLVELLVVVIIFAAVTGGLAFGLRWVRGKTGWAFGYADKYNRLAARYIDKGSDYVAKPFLVGGRIAGTVKGTALAIRREVRRLERPFSPAMSQTVAAAPVSEEPVTPEPLSGT
jgi:hypothetical protein